MNQEESFKRKVATASNKLIAMRLDVTKTAERFDEIVRLRQFIFDIQATEAHKGEIADRELINKIDKFSFNWGQKGDCV